MMDDTLQPVAESAKADAKPAEGFETFRSLCVSARVNQRMANALRVMLGIKREKKGAKGEKEFDKPCDPAAFKAALARLNPEA